MSSVSLVNGHIDYDEMTPQEAIKTIQIAISDVEWNYPMDYAIAFEVAISALEKRIPKKVIIRGLNPCKEISSISFVCPSCKQNISRQRYCCYCGQALDWSDTE